MVERARIAAKKNPRLLAAFRPKPPQMIFLEASDGKSDVLSEAEFIRGPDAPEIRRFRRSPA